MTTMESDRPTIDPGQYFAEHPEFEDCRKEGHNWTRFEPHGASFIVENEGLPSEVWKKERSCADCGQTHAKRWDRFGNALTDTREYPDGYVLIGEEMPNRGELWQRDIQLAKETRRAAKQKRGVRARRRTAA